VKSVNTFSHNAVLGLITIRRRRWWQWQQ